MKKVLLILITGFLFYNTANATASAVTFTAKQTGNWSDPNTWTITGTNTNSHTYPHSAGAYSDTLTQHDLVVIPSGFTVTLTANSYAYSMTLQGAIADAGFSLTIYQSGTSSSGATPLTTLSGNSGSFTGGGSLILTGHGYIKIYGGNGLTVDNLTVSQTVASSYPFFANICAMNSGTLIVTGTLALNSSGVFCLGTKALTLSNSISGATYFSGTNVQTGDGTSSLSAGTTVSATGVLAFKNLNGFVGFNSFTTFPA